ncbi:glycoside hydrolase family 31 protein [Streptomyces antimycoticus]|uniref:Glycoside hydrolase family 31 protein n=2 Tax=Streptomyces violaceusniger group TaxID=2839105 RepID=A0ABD5JPS0_9ACTN|nr:glycoside hydrolase family 31 protein [Streptomyces violaceusniger]KUL55645.1 glycosyl hydrolase [Streptomyces violaceusniger]MEE4589527.1 glycoside hydrolase family 31 protein [Streptomyces sp. DSM 41602]
MDARDLVRSEKLVRSVKVICTAQGLRSLRSAWRRRRSDAVGLPRRGTELARVPGEVEGADPEPGGGVVRFARSSLRVRVTTGGAVFCGWDGAEPEPSYALAGPCPEADERAELEPDTEGGWRVVSERVTVMVSRTGTVEVRTPGGVVLRRDLPPRWWEPAGAPGPAEPGAGVSGEGARWLQRSEVAADARFFGLGGRASGPRLRDGVYRLWNTDPGGSFGPGDDPLYLTMPVQLVVADAGTHLVFHDNSWDGSVTLREGEEGAGSGHDRPGGCRTRMEGGPLRYWVIVGTPARVLHGWTALTGAPAVPPRWALGHHHARWGFRDAEEVRRVVAGYRERDLPLSALHLDIDHFVGHRVFTVDGARFPDLPGLAAELLEDGVRLVSIVDPAVKAEPGNAVYASGAAEDVFVRDTRGREVRGVVWPGESVFPDFTDPRVRKWWGGLYAERLAQGFSGVWHDMNEPVSFAAFGETTLPRSARHALEGRGGDHREAHNVYALTMARAGYEGLCELRPDERPFLFSRSGWAGLQRYGGSWSGDVATGWAGLRASLSLVIGLGLSGVPFSGPDIGGFTGFPSPELYLRWFQLGAYLPLFRTHSAISAGRREPWEFGSEVLEHAAAALRERQRLMPYFTTLAQLAARTGAPYVRPVWWRTPKDRALRDCEDAFLLGDALLVAPVLEEGARRRPVRLPRGRWYDTVTGRAYDGPGHVVLDAPLSGIPVLARAGSVVPVAGADGGVELEVWTPCQGRKGAGAGTLAVETGDGWEKPELLRFATRLRDGVLTIEREGGGEVGYPVRIRGEAPPEQGKPPRRTS